MLTLSPPLFPTSTYNWPLDVHVPTTQNLQQDFNEANSYNTPFDFATNMQNFAPENFISMSAKGTVNGKNDDPMKVVKKLNHNASERDRRKRVNELYAFLRSLLPMPSDDQTKKVSIPRVVSRALKYIPELQQEVERLKNKREKILSILSGSSIAKIRNQSDKEGRFSRKSLVVSCVSVLGEKEVVIQLISSIGDMNKNKDIGLVSKALEYIEEEEDGLVLVSATTKCLGEERLLNTLHFEVHGESKIEAEKLKEKLCSLY